MDRLMRQTLSELELVSHGTVQSWSASGGTDSERDPRPRGGETYPPHDYYRDQYTACQTPVQRAKVLQAAREELKAITTRQHRETREETQEEFDTRARAKLAEGWTVQQVADHMRATPTRVRRAQAAADESTIASLAAEGLTVRGIAMRLGIPKSTVQRQLRKAA